MQRRDFLTVAGAVAVAHPMRNVECGMRNRSSTGQFRTPHSAFRISGAQEPSLSPEVFARRLDRARGELKARGLDLLIATPGTNYEYLTGYNPGRSERLIALLLPVVGAPAIVCPSFEVERIKRHSIVTELHGWEEQEDPHALVRETVRRLRPGSGAGGGTIALESSTAYQTFLRLGRALPGWKFVDAGPVTDRLRVIKSPEEVALLRRAIAITLDAMAATFAQLAVGTTEVQVAQTLSREMEQRGAPGGGLVQFGPSREFRKVFNVVHDAQTAAMALGRPGTPCEEMDRAARKVITAAGYGPFFTHRLGHGLGMDGHEPEYLVEGNTTRLEPGMVFTIEPGIYQLGTFGVRIEDDCVMTATGVEVLSQRAAKL